MIPSFSHPSIIVDLGRKSIMGKTRDHDILWGGYELEVHTPPYVGIPHSFAHLQISALLVRIFKI